MRFLRELVRHCLIGRRLDAALQRNNRAADDLDAVLREVMKR